MHSFTKNPLYAYDDTVAAVKALGELVTVLIDQGEDYSEIASGVTVLFHQQLHCLEEGRNVFEKALNDLKAATDTKNVRRIEPMGINMVMVTELDGRRYMTTPALAGVDPAGVTKPRFEETPMDMRKRVIAELVGDGKAAGDIAQAMGLKKDTVEKVIGQLLSRVCTQ